MNKDIRVIIPAYNEERSIARVINEIPLPLVEEIIVVDNGSGDRTAKVAKDSGATVLSQPIRGYGNACLMGMSYIEKTSGERTWIVVFLDGDYSDYPEEMERLISPIQKNEADLVIGSRALGKREKGSMTPQQLFGNWLATKLMKIIYEVNYTDLGPFRAIKWDQLKSLGMQDRNYGWTVEMQIKAIKNKLRCTEVPVNYRRRIGISKVSGTVKGTIMAGIKIIWTIFKYI